MSAGRLTPDQKSMIEGMIAKLRKELERTPKNADVEGNTVTVTTLADKHRTLTAEFRTRGVGLALVSGEAPERRHAFARLVYDGSDSSCTVRICPAIIPGLDLSAHHPGSSERAEQKLDEWRYLFGDVLRKPGIKHIEIYFGNLRDISHRPNKCQCHANE